MKLSPERISGPSLAKNVSYSLAANLVSMLLGVVAVLVLPKYLGGEEYGYYQLYLLYVGFTTLLAFGLPEGVYLSLGGRRGGLSLKAIRIQFVSLCVVDFVLYVSIILWLACSLWPSAEFSVFVWVCASGFVNCVRNYALFILQAKRFIKEYSLSVVIERMVSLVPIVSLVLLGMASMGFLLAFDTLGRVLSFIYVAKAYRSVKTCLEKELPPYGGLGEVVSTVGPGISLMIATYASTLIAGAVRIGIENAWGIVLFAQVSLVISLANMATRLINAVAIPVFPALKDKDANESARLYSGASLGITLMFFVAAVAVHPVAFLLQLWLPDYSQALRYAILLVPLCLFESKNALLAMSFLKSYREEGVLLAINAIALMASAGGVGVLVCLHAAVEAYLIFLIVVLGVRCVVGMMFLRVKFGLGSGWNVAWDIIASMLVIMAWLWGDGLSLVVASTMFAFFLVWKRSDLLTLVLHC